MMMGVVEKDKVQWEHTSNLIYAVFAPHMKKGTNISADRFNPYAKERMRIAAEKERERLKVFAASVRANVALVVGNVIVVPSVPANVRVLFTVNNLPVATTT